MSYITNGYQGFGIDFTASGSASTSGASGSISIGMGSGKKPGKCAGENWWRCAELVTYFNDPGGAGYGQRHIMVSGSIYQNKVAVINALLAMHMLSHTYGWANVKSQLRAMTWFLNKQRNWDFDDTLNQLESAVAPAYDKYAADEDAKLAAAKKQYFNLNPLLLTAMFAPKPPTPPPGFEKPMTTKQATMPMTMGPSGGMPMWPWLLLGGAVLAGGGYFIWKRSKKAA